MRSQVTVSSVGPMVIEMGANLSPQVAAQKRAACDVLKGQPRSSRDEPAVHGDVLQGQPVALHWNMEVRALPGGSCHIKAFVCGLSRAC